MDNAPAVRQNNLIPSDHEMTVFNVMAKSAMDSKMYKGIGDMSGIMMVMLAARELGISPVMALNGGLNIINGKTEISARMMNALIRRAGHSIKILESTETSCKLAGTRADNGDTAEASYTLAEAQKAGLVKPGGGWTKNPKDMCFARALSRLARQLFADVIGTGYVEGEIQAKETWNHPFMKEPGFTHVPVTEQIVIDMEDPVPTRLDQRTVPLSQQYYDLFPEEDKAMCLEYKEIVRKHFKWQDEKACEELLRDPAATVSKFNSWKEKKNASN